MYLFTFVFIVMSIIGLYTQVYVMRAARAYANIRVAAENMRAWHGAAYRVAVANPSMGFAACCVSPLSLCGALPACSSVVLDPATNPLSTLSKGYNYATYKWSSVLYPLGTVRVLVTYAAPPTANGVSLPSSPVTQPNVGYTSSEILQQLQKTDMPPATYGQVTSGTLVTLGQYRDKNNTLHPITFSLLPITPSIPNGSVAIVSKP